VNEDIKIGNKKKTFR